MQQNRSGVLLLWHGQSGFREHLLLDLIDQWNRLGVGVTVVAERHSPDLLVPASGRSHGMPQLLLVPQHIAASLDRNGALVTFDDFVKGNSENWSNADLDDLSPFVLKAGRSPSGALIGLPQGGTAHVLVYNRDLLRSLGNPITAPPTDWEAFASLCARISDAARGLACLGLESSASILDQWSLAHGARLFTPQGQFGLDALSGRAALDRVRTFAQQNVIYASGDATQLRDDFVSERTLYVFESTDHLDELRNAIKARSGFAWAVGALPATAGTWPTEHPVQAPLWVVPHSSPETERAARQFVQWMLAPAQAVEWAAVTGDAPTRKSSLIEAAKRSIRPQSELLDAWRMTNLASTAGPIYPGGPCTNEQVATAFAGLVEGGRTVDDALATMRVSIQDTMNRDCAPQR